MWSSVSLDYIKQHFRNTNWVVKLEADGEKEQLIENPELER